jgi:hypothetical protein
LNKKASSAYNKNLNKGFGKIQQGTEHLSDYEV